MLSLFSSFSHILLDAPCSGLGQRPQLRTKMTCKELASFPRLQKKLFATAVELLSPGGTLVYSTCTIVTEENEDVVAWAVKAFGGRLELVDSEPVLGGPGWAVEGLPAELAAKTQRFFGPFSGDDLNECEDTIGFYLAKFKKT